MAPLGYSPAMRSANGLIRSPAGVNITTATMYGKALIVNLSNSAAAIAIVMALAAAANPVRGAARGSCRCTA